MTAAVISASTVLNWVPCLYCKAAVGEVCISGDQPYPKLHDARWWYYQGWWAGYTDGIPAGARSEREKISAQVQAAVDSVLSPVSTDDDGGEYDVDPMDDIPAGTPDSWIPDNPNEDGFTQSDFI